MSDTSFSPGARFKVGNDALYVQVLLLIAAILAVYAGLVEHPFHAFDDPIYVTNVTYVRDGLTLEGMRWAFESMDVANWHPLTWLSHMLDVELYGLKPAGHYMTNLLLHSMGCLVLLRLLRLVFKNGWIAFLVAVLWAIHPANVECVAWIAQRKTLLALIFIFGGLILYLRYRRDGSCWAYLLCVTAQILAAMCKPIAVLFPVALVLLDVLELGDAPPSAQSTKAWLRDAFAAIRHIASAWRDKVPFILVAGYLSVVTFYAQDTVGATNRNHSLLWRIGNSLESIEAYTVKSFTMPETSALYVIRPLDMANVAIGAFLVAAMVVAIVWGLARKRIVAFGLAWYLLLFLPTIGLVQVGSQRLADRYLGFPLLGLLCVVVWAVATVVERRRAGLIGFCVCLLWACALGQQARALTLEWSDALRLSMNAIRHGGPASSMLINASVEQTKRHDWATARKTLAPIMDEAKAIANLAVLDVLEKDYEAAIAKAGRLFTDKSTQLTAAYVAATAYAGLGKYEDAQRAYRGAIRFLPPDRSWMWNVEEMRTTLPQLLKAVEEKAKAQREAELAKPAPPEKE